MEKQSLFQRYDHGNDFPYSRDYVLDIPCKRVTCPANKSERCGMASAITINSAGKCETGDLLIELEKKNKSSSSSSAGYYKHEGD